MQGQGDCSKFLIIALHSSLQVTWHTAPGTVVSCSSATVICRSNPECEIALIYFNSNCKELFNGGHCSDACKNSARILARQKAAAKLSTCTCDKEDFFDCALIRESTRKFCFAEDIVQEKEGGGKLKKNSAGRKMTQLPFSSPILTGSLEMIQWVLTVAFTLFGAKTRTALKTLISCLMN